MPKLKRYIKSLGLSEEEARLTAVLPPPSHDVPRASFRDRLLTPLRLARALRSAVVRLPDLVSGQGSPGYRRALGICLGELGVGVRPWYSERLPEHGAVLMWNQTSLLDLPVLAAALPVRFRLLHHFDLTHLPVLSTLVERFGHLGIDRFHEHRGDRALREAADWVHSGNYLLVSPETARSWDGRVLPMKEGAFRTAIVGGRPIVPVVLHGAHQALPRGRASVSKTLIEVEILPPVPVDGYRLADAPRLKVQVAGLFRKALQDGPPSRKGIPV